MRYDGRQFTIFTAEDGLPSNDVWGVLVDRAGNVWVGTASGVCRRDGERFTTVTSEQFPDPALWEAGALFEDGDGHIWFGLSDGISRYDGRQITTFTTRDGLADRRVYAGVEDRTGHVWVATGSGASRYEGEGLATFTVDDGLPDNKVISLLEDRHGQLWAGTGRGLGRYDGSRFIAVKELAPNPIRSISEDRSGNLWFATYGGGLSRYDGQRFTTFTTADGLSSDFLWCLLEDRNGNLWIGTDDGVNRYDGRAFVNITTADGSGFPSVSTVLQDRLGNLWFGAHGGEPLLTRYDGERFQTFSSSDGFRLSKVLASGQDGDGNLWFGGSGGVCRYDERDFACLTSADGLADDSVKSILLDSAGTLWFGTYGGGISRYDGSEFSALHQRHYRLEGVDSEWRRTRQDRVEYIDLPRGNYVFRVSAIDDDLNRSQAAAPVAVRVHLAYERIGVVSGLALAVLVIALQAGRIVQRDRRVRQANLALSASNQQLQERSTDLEQANRALKSTQSQLVQAEKMATVGLLAGGVAHEINNPLQILLDGARRILRFPDDTERHRQSAGLMEQAAQRCSSIVLNLLNYTRESGDEAEDVDLNEVVGSTVALLQHNLQQADIELQVDEGDPPPLEGNFTELCTVVTNLVLNARDATLAMKQEDGRKPAIGINTSSDDKGGALLAVRDNGGGIPENARERIFDPFFTTKEVGAGTGLGLSIVDGIVKRHQGRIEVQSELGTGTVFLIHLPAAIEGEPKIATEEYDAGESA